MDIETVTLLETSIDHLTGEEIGQALESLNAMPRILDALLLTGIGKKNRPAGLLQVLCRPEDEKEAAAAVFRHTHALGLRRSLVERYVLPRRPDSIEIEGRTLAAKTHCLEGEAYTRAEADEIARLAREMNVGAPGLRLRRRRR